MMQGQAKEQWRLLCEQIANEQNPERFSELVAELLAELEKKDKRLKESTKRESGE